MIVLANTAGANSGRLESRIAKLVLGIKDEEIVDLAIEAELLERLKGEYQLENGKIEIVASEGRLYAKPPGAAQDRLKYQGNLQFVSEKNSDMRIAFSPAEGRATGFDVEVEGQKLAAKRSE